ncbi:MAG: aminodeoxychorismate lyase [Gammaproteobacteria bacterium]|nr:aminodeoxychorismate lyase [Gammaproteobacteria bacterium]
MEVRFFDNSLKELSDEINLSQQRSFLYGDGHFTTAKVVDGSVCYLDRHLERLRQANKQLGFNPIVWNKLTELMLQVASDMTLGVIKIQISRGAAQRGYGQTFSTQPLIAVSTSSLSDKWLSEQQTPTPLTVANTKLGIQPLLAGLKHCNRLEQVLIARELEQVNLEDALVLDINNVLIETSKANVFWYHNNQWFTPCLKHSGVNGVMRQVIIDKIDVIISQTQMTTVIEDAEAMFICNGLIGVRPVSEVAGKQLSLKPVEQLRAQL